MSDDALQVSQQDGTAWVRLNRAERHNAFDDTLIVSLQQALSDLGADPAVRQVVLAAEGKSFCAGADLSWMRRTAQLSEAENVADAQALAGLMQTLDELPKPTIARVQGPAYGGGVGLVACCDIAITSEAATFCLSEVKLGLIPAAISPYVIAAIGARAARRYFLTAERFDAREAHRLGLVHEVVPAEALDGAVERVLTALQAAGPGALAAAKDLIAHVARADHDAALTAETAARIARVRASEEGREGVAAFLEKRRPKWRNG